MNIPFIFTSGLIVVILFLIGLIYTFIEFKEMYDHPKSYRKEGGSTPKVVKGESKSNK